VPVELIIGANGFLGQHLAHALRGRDCVLHSRTPASAACRATGLPFLQEDLVESRRVLRTIDPQTVYLLARPETQSANVLLDFTQNVQWLLQEWCDRRCLRRVVFASTQLVYATPLNDTPLPVASPLGPETPYDCHKAEMEFYLQLLSHHDSGGAGVAVEVFRLPLLGGRAGTVQQMQEQYLYQYRTAYQTGQRWSFPTDDERHKTWGTSWVHVDDVVALMITPAPAGPSRFRIVQPVSGHVSYLALDAFFRTRYALPPMRESLHLPKTAFYLQDNARMPPRSIDAAYPESQEVADENRAS
jgi:nucleoside-diphosphate-sugar epimerase